MNPITYRPALVFVIGVLGFLVAIAFNTARDLGEARPERVGDLAGLTRDMEHQRDELQGRLSDLRSRMNDLERDAAEGVGVRNSFSRELSEVRASAGLTKVEGPGIEVVLADSADVTPGSDPNDYIIHDTDVAAVVNALFVAGAEAVDVNGERVVATTAIRCAGTTILVNSVRLGGPYVIRAVGDPAALEKSLAEDPGASLLLVTYKSQFGLKVSTATSSRIEVAAYRGSLRPQSLINEEGAES
ncbi:MAG: DUF881 domain-containing protein [Coriobacteriia bacterium]|nr:DUF881 domain-containing protein [Coriobacteriia bacterium]